jgi:hypothetical protein
MVKKIKWQKYNSKMIDNQKLLNLFNHHWMFTNFTINTKTVNDICKIEGVETFDLLSRYTARIGFGKLFDEESIKEQIEDFVNKEELPFFVNEYFDKIKSYHKYYCVGINSNNQAEYLYAGSKEEIEKIIEGKEYAKVYKGWE